MTRTASLTIDSPTGPLTLTERDGALIRLSWQPRPDNDTPEATDATPLLRAARDQLKGYFNRELNTFDLCLNLEGSAFELTIWNILITIPFGQIRTYGQLAEHSAGCARSVGGACGANPIPIIVPCHRVVAANGRLGGFSGGTGRDTKRWLLNHEFAAPGPTDPGDKTAQPALF